MLQPPFDPSAHSFSIHVSQQPDSPTCIVSLRLPPPPCAVVLAIISDRESLWMYVCGNVEEMRRWELKWTTMSRGQCSLLPLTSHTRTLEAQFLTPRVSIFPTVALLGDPNRAGNMLGEQLRFAILNYIFLAIFAVELFIKAPQGAGLFGAFLKRREEGVGLRALGILGAPCVDDIHTHTHIMSHIYIYI